MHMKARSSFDLWHKTGCNLPAGRKLNSRFQVAKNPRTSSWNIRHCVSSFVGDALAKRHQVIRRWGVEGLRQNLIISLKRHSQVLNVFVLHHQFRQFIVAQRRELSQPLTHQHALYQETFIKRITRKMFQLLPCGDRSFTPATISSLPASLKSSLY